jgi:hypothetical protein
MVDRARCSQLLLVQPRIDTHNFRRLVVLTDFSEVSKIACGQALWLAEKDAVECVHVISIQTIFMDARARTGAKDGKPARTRAQEERLMEDFLVSLPKCQVRVDWNIVDATTGFAACEFADPSTPTYSSFPAIIGPRPHWRIGRSKSCRAVSGLCREARHVAVRRPYNNEYYCKGRWVANDSSASRWGWLAIAASRDSK